MVFINIIYVQFQLLTRIRMRNLELRIRIRTWQKFWIHLDPDPQHCWERYTNTAIKKQAKSWQKPLIIGSK
jgi:hypothetical protein